VRKTIIYLIRVTRMPGDRRSTAIDRRYRSRWCDDTRGSAPKIRGVRAGYPPSVLSCTVWGFSCPANYSASGELLPRLFNLAFSSLPKNRRCFFCDTFRHRNFAITAPARFTRHTAVWCSDFPPVSQHGSPAIVCHRSYYITSSGKWKPRVGRIVGVKHP
jgi:hypothetical protein